MTRLDVQFCKGFVQTNVQNVYCTDVGGKGLKNNNDRFILQFNQYYQKGLMMKNQEKGIPMRYFEIFIQHVSEKKPIFAIGLAKPNYDRGMVGWYDESIGYHADDGYVFHNVGNQHNTENLIGLYSFGDSVGVLLIGSKAYFTKNGVANTKAFELKNYAHEQYLPTLSSSDSDTTIKVLSPSEFKFNIDKFIKEDLKLELIENETPQRSVNDSANDMLNHCDGLKKLILDVIEQQSVNDSLQKQKDTEIQKLKIEITELQSSNEKLKQQHEITLKENEKLRDVKTRLALNQQDINNLSLEQLKELSRILLDTQNTIHSKEKDLLDVELLCVVCQDKRKNTLFLPCKHLCVCAECAESVKSTGKQCPVCRTVISDSIQTHL